MAAFVSEKFAGVAIRLQIGWSIMTFRLAKLAPGECWMLLCSWPLCWLPDLLFCRCPLRWLPGVIVDRGPCAWAAAPSTIWLEADINGILCVPVRRADARDHCPGGQLGGICGTIIALWTAGIAVGAVSITAVEIVFSGKITEVLEFC